MNFDHHFHFHFKRVLILLVVIVVWVGTSLYMKSHGHEGIIIFIKNHPYLGIAIYLVYAVISSITMSMPVVPFWLVIFLVYGFWVSVLATFIAALFGGTIDFFLARTLGRPFVKKIVPQKFLNEVDHIVNGKSSRSFVIFRVFANSYFGIVSYAAGLSRIRFGLYILITSITSLAWIIATFWVIKAVLVLGTESALPVLLVTYVATGVMGIVVWKIYESKGKRAASRK